MKFFVDFLSNFKSNQILHMYASGVFRTSEEIKAADLVINWKIIFQDEVINEEEIKIYKHLQTVVDAIRNHQNCKGSSSIIVEEVCKFQSVEMVEFKYFVKYEESEKEVEKLAIVQRNVSFSFKRNEEDVTIFDWLKGALSELLDYVLREFDESDRVGIVIRHGINRNRKAVFPITPKNHLEASIIIDTLNYIIKLKGSILVEDRLDMQVLRIRIPIYYRKFGQKDVMLKLGENEKEK